MSLANPYRDAALAALNAYISVLPPCQDGTKKPMGDEWTSYQKRRATADEILGWYKDPARTGVGFVCGAVSENLEMLEWEAIETFQQYKAEAEAAGLGDVLQRLLEGYMETTPGGGVHTFLRCSTIARNTRLASRIVGHDEKGHPIIKPKIETRGEGGYSVVAPSNGKVHETGRAYRLVSGGAATIATVTPEEREDLFALARSFNELPKPKASEGRQAPTGEGRPGDDFNQRGNLREVLERNGWEWAYKHGDVDHYRRPGKNRGTSASFNHRGSNLFYVFSSSTVFDPDRGYSPFAVYTTLDHGGDFEAAARALAAQGYGQQGRTAGREGVAQQPAPEASTGGAPGELTDSANGERYAAQNGDSVRWVPTWGKWLVYTGLRWEVDNAGRVMLRAKYTARSYYKDAAEEPNDKRSKALADHARRSLSARSRQAMVELAKAEPGISITPDQLDADPWLLNVANGTIDLHTGELRPHRAEDLITKLAPVEYDPAALCPTWLAFQKRIMAESEKLIAFKRRAWGYTLTGDTSERVLLIGQGIGKNGKSTELRTMYEALGDYALRTPTETLLAKRGEGVPNDVARLKGARFVYASESEQGRRLAEAFIKDITGNDVVSARFMRGEWFDFVPECKLWLATNHKPEIRGTDRAIWDRLKLIPYSVRIPEEEQDKHLVDKLLAELPGILAWAVNGCLEWQREGLGVPEEVKKATEGYKAEMDTLAEFLSECCIVRDDAWTFASKLWSEFQKWSGGQATMSQKALGLALKERGFTADKGAHGVRIWRGLSLQVEPPLPLPPEDDSPEVAHHGQVAQGDANFPIENTFSSPRVENPENTPQRATRHTRATQYDLEEGEL